MHILRDPGAVSGGGKKSKLARKNPGEEKAQLSQSVFEQHLFEYNNLIKLSLRWVEMWRPHG